jgi:hypothetical protein
MKYRQRIQTRSGWWCPDKIVSVRSSNRLQQPRQWKRWRSGCVSSCPSLTTSALPHLGHRTPSGQRIARTVSKHLVSSIRAWMLTIVGSL